MPEGDRPRVASWAYVVRNMLEQQRTAYHAMKQMTLAVRRRLPKPPKTQPRTFRKVLLLGGDIIFLPFATMRRWTCAESKPVFGETESLWKAS